MTFINQLALDASFTAETDVLFASLTTSNRLLKLEGITQASITIDPIQAMAFILYSAPELSETSATPRPIKPVPAKRPVVKDSFKK